MSCTFCTSLKNKQFSLTSGDCEHVFVLKEKPAENKWISLKDQLPERDEIVIVALCESGRTLASYNGDSWHWVDDFWRGCEPDYWIPLPNLPYEDTP